MNVVNDPKEILLFDFGSADNKEQSWGSVNDGVMGGLSVGKTTYTENSLVFEGRISFENNGGFASFRSRYQNFDLSTFSMLRIRYRAEGQRFALQLNQYQVFYYPNFRLYLETASTKDEWVEVSIPISEFKQHRMGKQIGGSINQKGLEQTIQLGFITTEKKEGPFYFEVDYILFEK